MFDRRYEAGEVRVFCENCMLLWPCGSDIGSDLPFFDIGPTLQLPAPGALTAALQNQGLRHAP